MKKMQLFEMSVYLSSPTVPQKARTVGWRRRGPAKNLFPSLTSRIKVCLKTTWTVQEVGKAVSVSDVTKRKYLLSQFGDMRHMYNLGHSEESSTPTVVSLQPPVGED